MERTAERITEPVAFHGEGPFWDAQSSRLLCVDVLAGVAVAVQPSGAVSRHSVPSNAVTVIRRRASGGLILGTEHGVLGTDDEFSAFELITEVVGDPSFRTNDGGCDPLGGLVIGSMAYDQRPGAGSLYRVAPDHRVTRLLRSVSISNGVQWSADGERVFFIDSPTRRVDVFTFNLETGGWEDRRVHVDFGSSPGFPDGVAIDEDDGLWVALWGGGAVNHYDALGTLVETIRVPGVTQVSSCTFGGPHRDVLYITTSRQGFTDDTEPEAGAIFAIQTDSRGAMPWPFGG